MPKHKTKTNVSNPWRQGKHVRATINFIEESGGTDITARKDKHVRISFNYKGRCCCFTLSATPRNEDTCAAIGRALTRHEIRVVNNLTARITV